jgi:hypothetical protein
MLTRLAQNNQHQFSCPHRVPSWLSTRSTFESGRIAPELLWSVNQKWYLVVSRHASTINETGQDLLNEAICCSFAAPYRTRIKGWAGWCSMDINSRQFAAAFRRLVHVGVHLIWPVMYEVVNGSSCTKTLHRASFPTQLEDGDGEVNPSLAALTSRMKLCGKSTFF